MVKENEDKIPKPSNHQCISLAGEFPTYQCVYLQTRMCVFLCIPVVHDGCSISCFRELVFEPGVTLWAQNKICVLGLYDSVFLEAGLASICSSGPIPQLSPPSSTTLVSPGLFCLVSLKSSLRGGTDLVHCRNERTPHHCPSSDPTGLGQKTELMLGCSSKQEIPVVPPLVDGWDCL